ncbi:MAG: hypothetical protein JRE58_00200 [Deltaproteobacteria bacterium]|nr:hypothetical protein [Deltaproteobacteria bacterium]
MYKKQSTKTDKSDNLLETYNSFVNDSNLTINIDSNTDLTLSSMFSLFDSINNYKVSLINESMINGSDSMVPSIYGLPFFSKLTDTIGKHCFEDIRINLKKMTVFELAMLQFKKSYGHLIRQKNNQTVIQKLKRNTFSISDLNLCSIIFQIEDKRIYRSYSNNSWEQGDRFYGTIPLLPASIRSCILINGKEVCELDFQGMQINMCYHMEGRNFQCDPYDIGPLDGDIFKKASLIMLHAESEKKAKQALGDELQDKSLDINGIIQCFKKIHADISKYFCSGAGPDLQSLETDITEFILKKLLKKNIIALPVHNSFIVQKQHKEELYFTMLESYKSVMNFYPVVK